MEVINRLLNYKDLKIVQNTDWFNFSLDSVLLCNFVTLNKNTNSIIDFCVFKLNEININKSFLSFISQHKIIPFIFAKMYIKVFVRKLNKLMLLTPLKIL